jgi:site-specific recombinase XerC
LHVHPHKFRRTFAVDALNATRDQDAVRKALGHEDARTTAIYTELAMDGLRDLNAAVTRHRGRRLSDEVASVLSPVRATISVARKEPL